MVLQAKSVSKLERTIDMIVKLHKLGEIYRGGWVFLDQKAWSE